MKISASGAPQRWWRRVTHAGGGQLRRCYIKPDFLSYPTLHVTRSYWDKVISKRRISVWDPNRQQRYVRQSFYEVPYDKSLVYKPHNQATTEHQLIVKGTSVRHYVSYAITISVYDTHISITPPLSSVICLASQPKLKSISTIRMRRTKPFSFLFWELSQLPSDVWRRYENHGLTKFKWKALQNNTDQNKKCQI